MTLRYFAPLALVSLLLIGGCQTVRQSDMAQEAARDVLTARAYDDISRAVRNDDFAATSEAIQRFARLSPARGNLEAFAQSLNAKGYELADKGTSYEEFRDAERYTRLAVDLYDTAILKAPTKNLRSQRATTRDSLAWALFRLDRLDEAENQQREALREARASGALVAELPLHLGDILAKAGKTELARAAYQETLTLKETEPDAHTRARAALEKLKS